MGIVFIFLFPFFIKSIYCITFFHAVVLCAHNVSFEATFDSFIIAQQNSVNLGQSCLFVCFKSMPTINNDIFIAFRFFIA